MEHAAKLSTIFKVFLTVNYLASILFWNSNFKSLFDKVSPTLLSLISETEFNTRIMFKGVLHLLPKISMFCALSQNNQKLVEK